MPVSAVASNSTPTPNLTPASSPTPDPAGSEAGPALSVAIAGAEGVGQVRPDEPARVELVASGPRVAVLAYHDLDARLINAYTITPAHFEAQILMLKEEGYAFYTLGDLERLLAGAPDLPPRGVLLTFDDGYSSFFTAVLPMAERHQVPVVSFLVAKYLDQIVLGARPHMSQWETSQAAASPFGDIAGHSYDAHHLGVSATGELKPALLYPLVDPVSGQLEGQADFEARIAADFVRTAALLQQYGAGDGLKHYAFPFTARSDEAVRLGQAAGFQFFYVGGEQLASAATDPTAIPRVHAGAPEITAWVLRERLRALFGDQ